MLVSNPGAHSQKTGASPPSHVRGIMPSTQQKISEHMGTSTQSLRQKARPFFRGERCAHVRQSRSLSMLASIVG